MCCFFSRCNVVAAIAVRAVTRASYRFMRIQATSCCCFRRLAGRSLSVACTCETCAPQPTLEFVERNSSRQKTVTNLHSIYATLTFVKTYDVLVLVHCTRAYVFFTQREISALIYFKVTNSLTIRKLILTIRDLHICRTKIITPNHTRCQQPMDKQMCVLLVYAMHVPICMYVPCSIAHMHMRNK